MDTFSAVADPVRRAILDALATRPMTAGQIADQFPISRPAVSRHLRILRQAGLVMVTTSGRTRTYRVERGPLAEIDAWLAHHRDTWTSRFDALETEVFRTRRERAIDRHERSERVVSPGLPDRGDGAHIEEEESA
jgi:DNA-binding transcriptional ArsR family regulator